MGSGTSLLIPVKPSKNFIKTQKDMFPKIHFRECPVKAAMVQKFVLENGDDYYLTPKKESMSMLYLTPKIEVLPLLIKFMSNVADRSNWKSKKVQLVFYSNYEHFNFYSLLKLGKMNLQAEEVKKIEDLVASVLVFEDYIKKKDPL